MQRQAFSGWIALLAASSVWITSVLALAFAMGQGIETSPLQRTYPLRISHVSANTSDLPVALGCIAFTLLQLASFLLFAFIFRACCRLRSAVCFSLAAGLVIAGDAAGLIALLVWLGVTLGAA